MAGGFREVFAPGVHAVASDEVAPAGFFGMALEVGFDLGGEGRDVLGVVEDGDPDAGFVSADAFEAFEHFKAADADAANGCEVMG